MYLNYIIEPYKVENIWCFDDEHFFIYKEPFVEGMSEMIDEILLLNNLTSKDKFRLKFSDKPFKYNSNQYILNKQLERDGGAEYQLTTNNMIGWLCPVVCTYFKTPPQNIYVLLID